MTDTEQASTVVKGGWSISRFAKEFGMDRRTVTNRIEESGIIPCGTERGNPIYAVADVAPLLIDRSVLLRGTLADPDFDPDLLPAKERKDWYQGTAEKLSVEEKFGRLIPKETHELRLAAIYKTIAATLETLGETLERECNLEPHIVEQVNQVTDSVREELAEQLEQIASQNDDELRQSAAN